MARSVGVLPPCRVVLTVLAITLGAVLARADVQPHAGMLRYPDISAAHIVFSYANDLWLVSRDGGEARPLASPPGEEEFPKFSPDGGSIAFVGNYDGNRDLYTIPISGGVPFRVTHHPAGETLTDWTHDDRLLFYAGGYEFYPARVTELVSVSIGGGLPEKLPLPYGANATLSPDGVWLAYTPHTIDQRTWKRYRGGMQTDIWLFNLKDRTSRQITDWEGIDTLPMWHDGKVYYLTDNGPEHRLNIWVFDPATGRRTQVTHFKDFDVKWPSIGPGPEGKGEIVFQYAATLRVLDLGSGRVREVKVTIPGDRPRLRPQRKEVHDELRGADVSPSGKRVVVEAHGDIWSLPAEKGVPRNLTGSDGVFDRDPAWSPDGRWVAYLSDATGEYQLYITQSDGRGETRKLTDFEDGFRYSRSWSPDSKHVTFADKAGRMYVYTLESGELKHFDTEPWSGAPGLAWSHDSRWIAYSKGGENRLSAIWVYNVKEGTTHQLTSGMFSDSSPTFDRKGDWIYYASNREFSNPRYEDIGTTWIYTETGRLLAMPLRKDVKSPLLPKADEEEWDKEDGKKKDDDKDNGGSKDGKDKNGDAERKDEDNGDGAKPEARADDPVSGTWAGHATGPDPLPPDGLDFTLVLQLAGDSSVSGSIESVMFSVSFTGGTFDAASGALNFAIQVPDGPSVAFELTVKGESLSGTATAEDSVYNIAATRTSKGDGADKGDENGKEKPKDKDKGKDKPREKVEIEFDGIEARAMLLPISRGAFYGLSVNDAGHLIYVRAGGRGSGESTSIRIVDLTADTVEEKTVLSGVGSYALTPDGKKLLARRGNELAVVSAKADQKFDKKVPLDGMAQVIDPRAEWRQILRDVWRIQRDFFYDPHMHGVDWPAIHDQYAAMIPDCASRDDVSYVIREMISELNVGHAYYRAGSFERAPSVSVGLLGCDFELGDGAYRIRRIIRGGPWDADARGPLSQPGVDAKEGDYVLAVNGVPVDVTKDPWAAFIGLAGKTIELTLSDKPVIDDTARRVVIRTLGGDGDLRFRAWIEHNRRYVEKASGGKVGYIYVPNTGVDGQNELVRQFFGQVDKPALIIDERWNGGGQIPTRFIELLNRPVANYWARRDGNDWTWPPDSHQGPKCMLINGLAGSGGDYFPFWFRASGLGKLIGTRTWGGLVGISGNPQLIDGTATNVPTFAFYETDGTWGIEGHGVDPDIQVIDDPAKMVDGADPQLDAAIKLMLDEIRTKGYKKPDRPAYPDRRGMGIREEDK
ncbi:MAG: PDZ domain-containing protein [Phycisphaerae bacterium]|nr:PDZ domain-containing protein [Phycisphaerae bacterium]MCZ2398495.1 PDZ domain-containing protein [Phycisphaerae bacterium]NUQ49357.1 PDZ domain-containing protein [Phycisphaerae bacterium]